MRNRVGSVIWGVVLIVVALVIALNSLDIIDVSLFFDGWWTLFIIVPCLIDLIQNGLKTSNIIGLLIGMLLLLSAQDIIDWGTLGKLIVPIILLCIAFSILFKDTLSKNSKKFRELNKEGLIEFTAIFSGQEIKAPAEKFEGANIDAIFGGIDLDLRNAIIEKDIVINASAIFGGIDIIVPANTNVRVSNVPIFGGIGNKAQATSPDAHTIFVNGFCMFGGVDIK